MNSLAVRVQHIRALYRSPYVLGSLVINLVIFTITNIPSHLKCVATLPCEMSSVLKTTIQNKANSVTTHLKN